MNSSSQANNFSREELTLRLEKIAERNRPAVCVFAARCVLRTLPLLTQAPLFNYWIAEDKDNRAHHLLALWRGILAAWVNDNSTASTNAQLASEAALAIKRSNWLLAADTAEAASYVNASVHMSVGAAGYAVHFARLAILNAALMENYRHTQPNNFDAAIYHDLEWIEKENNIAELPLQSDILGEDNSFVASQHLIRVIVELELHDKNINVARSKLVGKISDSYQKLQKGTYSESEAKNFLERINLYFLQPERFASTTDDDVISERIDAITPPTESLLRFTASRQQAAETISEEDHLNRKKLVETLASFLTHPANYHHQTIGLLGDWGVGKSSFIHLLKESILKNHAEQRFLFGEFNAWAYENTDNLQAGIAQEIIKALSSPEPRIEDFKRKPKQPKTFSTGVKTIWCDLKKTLSWYAERSSLIFRFAITLNGGKILWLLVLIFVAVCPWFPIFSDFFNKLLVVFTNHSDPYITMGGRILWAGGFLFYLGKELQKLLANPMAKELLTYIRLPDYAKHLGTIPQMRKNIETLCRVRLKTDSEKSKRLLFVVDDLDRCGHQAIVKVLEAVRLVLDIENVMVVIAVDQRIALSALALHYKDFAQYHNSKDSRSIARDYLAKVIHLPITLYKPKGKDVEAYLKFIWSQLITEEHKTILEKASTPAVVKTTPKIDKPLSPENNNTETPTDESNIQSVIPNKKTTSGEIQSRAKPETASISTPKPSPTPVAAAPTVIASLSSDHQKAFLYWVDYFELSNPRQVKRLNNSYNLLHSYYDYDSASIAHNLNEIHKKALVFPMMLALFIMEYLNTLDDQVLRAKIKVELRAPDSKIEEADKPTDTKIDSTLIGTDIIHAMHKLTEKFEADFIKIVEPFVLPAIECH